MCIGQGSTLKAPATGKSWRLRQTARPAEGHIALRPHGSGFFLGLTGVWRGVLCFAWSGGMCGWGVSTTFGG